MHRSINLELVQNKGRPVYLETKKLSSHIEEIDQTKYPDVKCVKKPGEIFVALFYIRKDNNEVQEFLDSRTVKNNFNGRILGYLDPFKDRPKKLSKGNGGISL